MSVLREAWTLDECSRILNLTPRRVRGWLDEPGLIPGVVEYRAPGSHSAERHVNRRGLVTLALLQHLSSILGEKSPVIREVLRSLPEDAARVLDGVDLERDPGRDLVFVLGADQSVTLRQKFFKKLAARLDELGLTV